MFTMHGWETSFYEGNREEIRKKNEWGWQWRINQKFQTQILPTKRRLYIAFNHDTHTAYFCLLFIPNRTNLHWLVWLFPSSVIKVWFNFSTLLCLTLSLFYPKIMWFKIVNWTIDVSFILFRVSALPRSLSLSLILVLALVSARAPVQTWMILWCFLCSIWCEWNEEENKSHNAHNKAQLPLNVSN